MNRKICFLVLLILIFIPLNVNAVDATPEEQREALIATAHAYYDQGVQMQYDSYRKNLYASPEDATSKHYAYTVCSGFIFQTYYQTLGIKIPDTTEELLEYAKENQAYTDTILFYYESYNNYSKLAEDLTNKAKPGDIFVVTRTCYVN